MIQDNGRTEATDTPAQDDDNFLSRWSRRKREVERTQSAAPVSEPAPEPGADEVRTAVPEAPSAGAEPELPPIESLDENSDYRPFLSSKVSDKIQRMALRKLFSSAGFNVRDGLDDYDDDFTVFEPLGDIITADMKHQAEVEEARERARRLAAGEAQDDATAESDVSAEDPTAEVPTAGDEQSRPVEAAQASGSEAADEADRSAAGAEATDNTPGRVG